MGYAVCMCLFLLRKRTLFHSVYAVSSVVAVNSMKWSAVFILSILTSVYCDYDLAFPPGFRFGASSSAYQIEGGWNASDKGESIWDRLVHTRPYIIADGSDGDVACDSYHQWEQDINIAKELGIHFYRFSISWPRLLPTGFDNYISEDGKQYYNNLIDGLLEAGIEPVVTIYHWDLPQSLQDLGGWTNALVTDWFADYARVVFTLYGDRVKTFLTINEPMILCECSYNTATVAPAIVSPEVGTYLCNKNTLIAHAKAWRIYDEEFRPKYHGEIAICNQLIWIDPLDETESKLAELARENMVGRYSHPIYSKEGGWPPTIEEQMRKMCLKRGYSKCTFPAFTQEEIELVRGTYDFYAMNHYTSRLIRKAKPEEVTFKPWPLGDAPDLEAILTVSPEWRTGVSSWLNVYPEGIRKQLVWLKKRYGDLKILITENGFSTSEGLDDEDRIQYYKEYLAQVLLAIKEDGVNVTGYTAWTMMDNFEWFDGYVSKFGLYEVNFTDPMRRRTARKSARFYANFIRGNSLVVSDLRDEL